MTSTEEMTVHSSLVQPSGTEPAFASTHLVLRSPSTTLSGSSLPGAALAGAAPPGLVAPTMTRGIVVTWSKRRTSESCTWVVGPWFHPPRTAWKRNS